MVGGIRDGWEPNEPRRMTRQEWQTLKVQDFDRLEARVAELEDVLTRTGEALTTCYAVLDGHFETLWRLAAHYPEAQHVLSSPRKHDSLLLLEAIIHRLEGLRPSAPAGPPSPDQRE